MQYTPIKHYVTHTYEFPSENMSAPFGAGWQLSGSSTRSMYFPVGSTLDDIINIYNGLQDAGTPANQLLAKSVVLGEVEYTREKSTDTVTLRYPTISGYGPPDVASTGNVTITEKNTFKFVAVGAAATGWMITNRINHPIVTITMEVSRSNAAVNPRFLSMFEAIDYKSIPGGIIKRVDVPGVPTPPLILR